jgi:hypothetical protein
METQDVEQILNDLPGPDEALSDSLPPSPTMRYQKSRNTVRFEIPSKRNEPRIDAQAIGSDSDFIPATDGGAEDDEDSFSVNELEGDEGDDDDSALQTLPRFNKQGNHARKVAQGKPSIARAPVKKPKQAGMYALQPCDLSNPACI